MWTQIAERLMGTTLVVEADRLAALWRFLAMSGCRRGEALALRWDDVDLEAGEVCIRRALVPLNGEVIETEPKTARGRRTIALDAGTSGPPAPRRTAARGAGFLG